MQQPTVKPVTGDAFEDVLYGSESELDDSDEEGDGTQRPSAATGKQRKTPDYGARLRVDDDEPMDLLSGAASRITSKQRLVLFLHFHLISSISWCTLIRTSPQTLNHLGDANLGKTPRVSRQRRIRAK